MKLLSLFKYLKEYGIKCTAIEIISRLFPYSKGSSSFRWNLLQIKHKTIMAYLYKHYYKAISNKHLHNEEKTNPYPQRIWTAWLQGEENAPEVIQLTISSIRKNAGGHIVVVLTNNNIDDYVQIPQKIKKKHDDGIIGHAHYVDVIRMLILARYGGIWLDATTFLHKPIEEDAFDSQFYSIGFNTKRLNKYVSDYKWIVGHIGGCKDSKYLGQISTMLVSYWEEHSIPIDYFVFDYLIAVLYKNDFSFQSVVDDLKRQKRFTNGLALIVDEAYNEEKLRDLFSNNDLYILSYRKMHQIQNQDGLITNYGYLYNEYLEKKSKGEERIE